MTAVGEGFTMTRMGRCALGAAIAALVGLVPACGSDDDDATGASNDTVDEVLDEEGLDVDSCTLLTNEEVSAFAGYELEATEDGPLGCAFVEPGEVVGDLTVHSYRGSGDAAAEGAEIVPGAEIINLDGIGDDAVALNVGGSVNFLVARQGDLFVVLVTTFLGVTPDSVELDGAAQLASTALGRLVEAA